MKVRGLIKGISLLTLLGLVGACKTSGNASRLDEDRGELVLQSSGDKNSVLPDLKESRVASKTVEKLDKEIENNPRDVDSLLNLAQVQLLRGDLNQAEENCRKALRVDLKNRDAKKIMAEVAIRRGNHDMAAIILNGLGGAATKDSQILNMMALIALKKGENAAALAYFKKALSANPTDVAVRMNLGVLYLEYRQLAAASVEFERVLGIVPDHGDAKMHLAVIKASRGDLNSAESTYREVLARDRANPVALYNLAVVQNQKGDYDDALESVKSYMKTPYARSSETAEIFALIEDIKRRKTAKGEKVSDNEINVLAAKLRSGANTADDDELEAPVLKPSKSTRQARKGPVETVDMPSDDGIKTPDSMRESPDSEINRLEKELAK